MKNTDNNTAQQVDALVAEARRKLAEDMADRGYGAIIWDNARAGFHYIPEIDVNGKTIRVTGLYHDGDQLYAIAENAPHTAMSGYYREGIEVAPVVVTLTEDAAGRYFDDPTPAHGLYDGGSTEEWLAIADCYYEALNEK